MLCCIPSHLNIPANERFDTAAKSVLSLPVTNTKLQACEITQHVSHFYLEEWQVILSCNGNKLHIVYPTVDNDLHSTQQKYILP